ncbi:type II toxin-antitoxin system VapC family toxin [Candidatus Bathyarchaeota archaeon]|nr:type II toxin-antitoxin system VapC family toxin [Candidatus Bathyarchaeota archaeon]
MILLDSSLIVAYFNKSDLNHAKALKVIGDLEKGLYGKPIITDYIFDEVLTVMLFKIRNVALVVDFGEKLLDATLMLRVDEDSFRIAWKIFKDQEKPILSFTDCTSIAICKTNGISKIATFDEDFRTMREIKIIGY